MLLVQRVTTTWYKRSRTGKRAVVRNALPEAFEIHTPNGVGGVLHEVEFSDESDFESPNTEISTFDLAKHGNTIGALLIRKDNDEIGVHYRPSWFEVGAPDRSAKARQVMRLACGDWGQAVHTGRSSSLAGFGAWRYKKVVYNIAYHQSPPSNLFLVCEPRNRFEDIANLR